MLQLRLFGSPQIMWHESIYPIQRRQTRALLFLLATHLQPISRNRLGLLFWPEEPKTIARRKVSRLISELRNALPQADLLRANDNQIWLDERQAISDAAQFTSHMAEQSISSLKSAIDLYQAPFLDNFRLSKRPEYDVWMAEERRSFEINMTHCLEMLIELHTVGRNTQPAPDVISYVQQLVALDPLDEKAQSALILRYIQSGDREAALDQYQEYIDLLYRNEMGEPSSGIQTLFHQIVSPEKLDPQTSMEPPLTPPHTPSKISSNIQSPVSYWPATTSITRAASNPLVSTELSVSTNSTDTVLIGRQPELLLLNQLYERACFGLGAVAMVSGEAGIGKTAVINELLRYQASTELLFCGSAYPGSDSLPFSLLLGAIRSAVSQDRQAKSFFARLPIQYQSALVGLLPEFYDAGQVTPEIGLISAVTQMVQFEALCQLLFAIADKQNCLVLVLENLQWADATTMEWLQYFGQRIANRKVLVVTSIRENPEQPTLPWSQLCSRNREQVDKLRYTLHQSNCLDELKLNRHSIDEISELAVTYLTIYKPEEFGQLKKQVSALAHMAGGNPGFARMILTVLKRNKWAAHEQIDWERIAMHESVQHKTKQIQLLLSTESRRLLNMLAVMGPTIVSDELQRIPIFEAAELSERVAELAAHSCITFENQALKFRHEILRLALVLSLHPWQRNMLQITLSSSHL